MPTATEDKLQGLIRFVAAISGEMKVDDVPLAKWADVKAIQKDDADPFEVIVEVPVGMSKRGWYYTAQALQRIVDEVMATGLPGFLGHQKPEDVSTQFPTPVTHWVGAMFKNDRAYFRGVIDKSAPDLKRWIRSKVIRQVSIFGRPGLQQVGQETRVVDYEPLSIDWTPLNRPGMPTAVVATGEMAIDTTIGGPYQNKSEVPKTMDLKEHLQAIRNAIANNQTTLAAICGEMNWDFKAVASALAADQLANMDKTAQFVGEMAGVFGMDQSADPAAILAMAKEGKKALDANAGKARTDLITKVVGEMVVAEAARPLVTNLVDSKIAQNATEDDVKKIVGEMVAQDFVKGAIAGIVGGSGAPNPQAAGRQAGDTDKYLTTSSQGI